MDAVAHVSTHKINEYINEIKKAGNQKAAIVRAKTELGQGRSVNHLST